MLIFYHLGVEYTYDIIISAENMPAPSTERASDRNPYLPHTCPGPLSKQNF